MKRECFLLNHVSHRFLKPNLIIYVGVLIVLLLASTNQSYASDSKTKRLSGSAIQQQLTVNGKVVDSSGAALPGVTVVVKGTTNGQITNVEGNYTLSGVPANSTLQFTFVGMEAQEVVVSGQSVINVTMQESTIGLEEVVATGYGTQRKKDIIGSVAIANTDDMKQTPTSNAIAQLQGRVAGVNIVTDGSGNASKIRIRGFGSFGNNDPLYIIDGISGSMSDLNPNDIESVQILKDAASAAIYGSQAANGVIIVTTKRGKKNSSTINFDAYVGVNNVPDSNFPDVLDSYEYGEYIWKMKEGAGLSVGDSNWGNALYGYGAEPVIPDYIYVGDASITGADLYELQTSSDPSDQAYYQQLIDPENYDYYNHQIVPSAKGNGTNWFDEVFNPAMIQSYSLNAAGGGDRGTYSISLSYFDQESTTNAWGNSQRYTLRVNSSLDINSWLSVGESLQANYNYNKAGGSESSAGNAWTFASVIPVYDIAGNYAGSAAKGVVDVGDSGSNPIWSYYQGRFNHDMGSSYSGNVYAQLTPIKDLVLKTTFGFGTTSNAGQTMNLITYNNAENGNQNHNSISGDSSHGRNWTWQNTATYSKKFDKHSIQLLIGSEAQSSYRYEVSASREDLLIDDDPNYQLVDAATGTQTNSGSWEEGALYSLFGRLDYNYDDKYLINATLRRDGSPGFGQNNRFGYFPSAAIGWRISSESFMEDVGWVTDLKLRASYGITGNGAGLSVDNIYTTYTSALANTYPIDGAVYSSSYVQASDANPNAKWEESVSQNYGFDATLLDGAWIINAEYYVKETRGLLVTRVAPSTALDVDQPKENVGNIRNRGIEFTIQNNGKVGQVSYNASLNFTRYENEVVKYLDNPNSYRGFGAGRISGDVGRTTAGWEISTYYGYTRDGFFNSQEEVDAYNTEYSNEIIPARLGGWKLKDINGDKVIDGDDRGILGSPHPDFQVGFNLGLEYKNFDLTGFLFWNQGGEVFNQSLYGSDFNSFNWNRRTAALYDTWTEDNHNAALPSLNENDNKSYLYSNDYYVEDATYIRLKTLQLGYTFPQSIVSKIGASKLRIYVQAENLWTWTNKECRVLDPGASLSGEEDTEMGVIGLGQNPTAQQFLFGINFGL